MTNESPIQIGGNVPEKTLGRIGEALADLISPITETAGLIGDSVRFHREEMAKRRIRAALDRAERLQLRVHKAPLKFVTGVVEGASMESEDSPLNELWENLLVSGLTSYETYLHLFTSTLRQFGGSKVQVLKALMRKHGSTFDSAALIPQKAEESDFPKYFRDTVRSDLPENEIWDEIITRHDTETSLGYHLLGATFVEAQQRLYFRPSAVRRELRCVRIAYPRTPNQHRCHSIERLR